MEQQYEVLFGIDLGTTYSCVAYLNENEKVESIKNAEGVLTTPSVIYFDSENSQIVGDEAKNYSVTEPEKSVSFIKREMGTEYRRTIFGTQYSPEELSSKILTKLVQDANNTLKEQGILEEGKEVKKVVITCPAYFGVSEKNATKVAGEIAGLEVLDIINEPTAAAINYGQINGKKGKKRVLVYDLGGGTFDVTIMDIDESNVKVICTGGDDRLGGKDWDEATVKALCRKWQEENGSSEDITMDLETKSNMLSAAEKAKKTLSQKEVAKVNFVHDGENFRTELKREEFDNYTSDLLTKTIQMTDACIKEMNTKDSVDIDEIILVGGSSRMPQVKKKIEETYKKPVSMFDPDEAVAKGAAIYAHNINAYNIILEEEAKKRGKTAEEIQQEIERGNISLPATSGGGTAIKLNISNVSSRTYGVKTIDTSTNQEIISNIIYQNDPLPATNKETYLTMVNNQSGVNFDLFETTAKEDIEDPEEIKRLEKITTFNMKFTKPVPAETPIEVTLTLNNSGLISIYAEEMLNHSKLNCEFQLKGGLDEQALSAAIKRAEKSNVE